MSLPRVYSVAGAPAAAVVELLESMLAEAKAGRVKQAVIAWSDEGGHTCHAIAWEAHQSGLALVGELERTKLRLLRKLCPDGA